MCIAMPIHFDSSHTLTSSPVVAQHTQTATVKCATFWRRFTKAHRAHRDHTLTVCSEFCEQDMWPTCIRHTNPWRESDTYDVSWETHCNCARCSSERTKHKRNICADQGAGEKRLRAGVAASRSERNTGARSSNTRDCKVSRRAALLVLVTLVSELTQTRICAAHTHTICSQRL